MKRYQVIIILLNLVLLLGFYHYSVREKERTLNKGKLILLELAPVDPRSLMQGDYMRLSYAIASNDRDSFPIKGYYVVKLDSGLVAQRVRIQASASPLAEGEYLIKYHQSRWQHSLGADDYFFQEGQADHFAHAKYGGIMVDNSGNSILVGLYDTQKKLLK